MNFILLNTFQDQIIRFIFAVGLLPLETRMHIFEMP